MTDFIVPESFPPGHFIKSQMEARGWNQADLAEIMDVDKRVVHELITAKRRVTPKTARALADAFGNPPEEWLNLQSLHDLAKESIPTDNLRQRRSLLWNKVPVREMINRGWLAETENIAFLEAQVLQFLHQKSLNDSESTLFSFAARKSSDDETVTKEQLVWLQRARNLAEAVPVVANFDHKKFANLLDELMPLRTEPEEARHVPQVLMNHGLRFLVIEHTRGSKIDGACFWLGQEPVIALSMRYNRIDWFWFTLAHELGHVYYKHGRTQSTIDTRLVGADAQPTSEKSENEKKADQFAERLLIDEEKLAQFISNTAPAFSLSAIVQFAERIAVHPGIVVGRLHHMGKMPYRNGREMLIGVREIVTETAMTDGWNNSIVLERQGVA